MKKYIIIVAGGVGKRMNSKEIKQFMLLCNEPVLFHTLRRCYSQVELSLDIILVLPKAFHGVWEELCVKYNFSVPHKVVEGGSERFFSVKNGLDTIDDKQAIVAVHDGVRPLFDEKVMINAFNLAEQKGTAIPVIPLADSLRRVTPTGSFYVDRKDYVLVQTPQVFRLNILKKAYSQPYSPLFTDDASVVQSTGQPVQLFPGNAENIKITTPFDLLNAEAIMNSTFIDDSKKKKK